jgi:hypothetical protein
MLVQVRTWAIAAGAAVLFATSASAQFSDGFEQSSGGHPAGSGAGVVFTPGGTGTLGWRQWDGAAINDSLLHDNSGPITAHRGKQYMGTQLASDTIREWSTYTTGHWDLALWSYVPGPASPTPMQDSQWLVLLNAYNDFGPYEWATQLNYDPLLGQVTVDNGYGLTSCAPQWGVGTTLTFDTWKETVVDVDLDLDTAQVYYDGAPLGEPFAWSQGPFGNNGGAGLPCPPPVGPSKAIGCIDLYANSTVLTPSFIYWDDISISVDGTKPYCGPSGSGSTSGCLPTIAATKAPNTTHTSGCTITVSGVEGAKNGIIFYGTAPLSAPWCAGGNAFLCVKAPTQRTAAQNSGGTAGSCNGSLSLNWDAFQIANPGALGQPWGVGSKAYVQGWFRDPPNCKTTFLSEALEMTYQ